MRTTPAPPASRRADLADGPTHVNISSVLDALIQPPPAPQAAGRPRSPLTALLPVAAPPATATSSKAEAEVVAAAPPPAPPPPQIPYQAGVSVGPVKAVASGPDPWDVFWLLAGVVTVGAGGVALVRHVDAVNRRAAARERREDRLVAQLVREDMALRAAKRAARRGRV